MAENDQTLFRKKAMDKISSPEQLTDYLRVTSPRMWIIIAAVALLLAAGIVWSAIGSIEIVKDVHIVVSDGEARIVTLIPSDVEAGMIVRIAGEEYLVSKTEEDEFGIKTGLAYVELPDGQYLGKIVTGEIKLIRYILGDR